MTEEEIDMVIFQSHGKEGRALLQLRAERDELKAEYPRCPNCEYEVRLSPRERKFLEAERDALKADAERFIWLADRLQDISIDLAEPEAFIDERNDWAAAWRSAIDAARGE